MGDLTADYPKCLTELAGKRLLDWQLAALKTAGIQSVTVIRGYRKELLSSSDYSVLDNPDWANTNMVVTLSCAANLLREFLCVVSYGDIVYHPDHVRALADAEGDITISYDILWESLWSARFENPLADAETFKQENGWLKAIGERTDDISDIQGQYIGLLKFTPTGWTWIETFLSKLSSEEHRKIDMTGLLRGLLTEGHSIRCVPVKGGWCEVDNPSDVQLYEQSLKGEGLGNSTWDHDWHWQDS